MTTSSTHPEIEVVFQEQYEKNRDVFKRLKEFDEGKHYNTNEIVKKFNQLLKALKEENV